MLSLTLLLSFVSCSIIFLTSPLYGLIVYVVSFAWYPTYCTIPIGTLDFTLRRIVILAIFFNLFFRSDTLRKYQFTNLDKCVIIYFLAQFLAGILNGSPLMSFLENRSGAILDQVLPYFAIRIIIYQKSQYLAFLKGILLVAAPIAVFGFYECITGDFPLKFLRQYNAWGTLGGVALAERIWSRAGFYRAMTVFSHPIMFGLFFAMFGPICVGLLACEKKHRILSICGIILMGVGVFSSMSSGPLLTVFLAVPFILFYRWRKYWKPIVLIITLICSFVEVASNRHFYDVLSDFAFNSSNAWYRSKLIDVALFEGGMSGHWLTGFPLGADPGWGPKIVGFEFTDIVNHYLFVLSLFGLVGFVPFLILNLMAVSNLVCAFRNSIRRQNRWIVWCLSSSFVGLLCTFVSVSIYGPPITVYYMMLGFSGIMPLIVGRERVLVKAGFETKNSVGVNV